MSEEKLNKIRETINNLLALSKKNDNKNEALSALNKARELMIKYNIEESEIKTKERVIVARKTDISIKMNWKKIVVAELSEYLKVKVYNYSGYLSIYGYDEDTKLAEIFLRNILDTVNKQANKYIKKQGDLTTKRKTALKNDYIMAFSESIVELWETQNKQVSNSLIVVLSEQVKESYEKHTSEGFKSSTKSVWVTNNANAIQQGRQAGRDYLNKKAILNG